MSLKVGVVIVCAGVGERLGNIDKAVLDLEGLPLFFHSVLIFNKIKSIKQIVLVVNKQHFELAEKMISSTGDATFGKNNKNILLVEGGKKRKISVLNGLESLKKDISHVLIHDGARPLVTGEIINRIIDKLKFYSAVICGIKVNDCLKLSGDHSIIKKTLKREKAYLIQTPQAFKKELILAAYDKFFNREVYDDSQLVELMGEKIKIVEGGVTNFKITYPEDIFLAKLILSSRNLKKSC